MLPAHGAHNWHHLQHSFHKLLGTCIKMHYSWNKAWQVLRLTCINEKHLHSQQYKKYVISMLSLLLVIIVIILLLSWFPFLLNQLKWLITASHFLFLNWGIILILGRLTKSFLVSKPLCCRWASSPPYKKDEP